jgi:hypothetical protein
MAKGFVCIKCGIGTLVKSNMKMTPDGKPYCRNEIGCAARVAKQWSKPLDNPLGPKNDFDLWTGRFESRKQELINGGNRETHQHCKAASGTDRKETAFIGLRARVKGPTRCSKLAGSGP